MPLLASVSFGICQGEFKENILNQKSVELINIISTSMQY